ncbi:hypothetical protein [Deinococcus petrolearius]|uniref:Uncharacterized protein n=1 Tax=Deinococcus petrolearius TaxID=1751295 RepID=A0ABW1DND1_9DEIO
MSGQAAGPYVGRDARQFAERKARYGGRDWVVWTARAGERCCAPLSAGALKAAMLDHGTQREGMLLIHRNGGEAQFMDWADAVQIRRNLRYFG